MSSEWRPDEWRSLVSEDIRWPSSFSLEGKGESVLLCLRAFFSRISVCYVSLYRLSLNLKVGKTLEKKELYDAHMTDLFCIGLLQ